MNTRFFVQMMAALAATLANVLSATKRAALTAYNQAQGTLLEAALAFDQAVQQEGAATEVAEGMIDLVSELVPGDVSDETKARLKSIGARIVNLDDKNAEEKLEALIGALIDAKDAGYELVTALNTPDEEEPVDPEEPEE